MKKKSTISSQSSTNGIRDIDSGSFTAKDVCEIIKVCGTNGVRHFSFKELSLSFTEKVEEVASPPQKVASEVVSRGKSEREADEYLGELLLTDPQEYERIIEKEAYLDESYETENGEGFKSSLR